MRQPTQDRTGGPVTTFQAYDYVYAFALTTFRSFTRAALP